LKLSENRSKNETVSDFFFSWSSSSWSCSVFIRSVWNRFRRIGVQKDMFQQQLKLFNVQLINLKNLKKKLFYLESTTNKNSKKNLYKKSFFY
jgi:hypothetical protein